MADSSMQCSVSKPLSMEKIEKMINNPLYNTSNNLYDTTMKAHSTENNSVNPVVTLSHSHLLEKQHALSTSNSFNIRTYQKGSGIPEVFESHSLSGPFSSTCCQDPDIDEKTANVMEKYRMDAMKKEPLESSDQWVDYQFTRLIKDRKTAQQQEQKDPRFANKLPARLSEYCRKSAFKPTKIEEIISQYSINPSYNPVTSSLMPPATSCRFASVIGGRYNRLDWMNRSHNNEYLETTNSEVEQVRRIGSSVDGGFGKSSDMHNSKCSLSNSRCRTPVASNMQLHTTSSEDYKDYKTFPDRVPSESEVDLKEPPTKTSRSPGNEVRNEMTDLSNFFQKEMERFRHVETLFKKTPIGGTNSGSAPYFQSKLSSRYSSRFLTDLTERRAYSSTDYTNRYVTTDWRSSSPHRDYIGRTSSSPSYRNITSITMPRTNYWSDFNTMQHLNTAGGGYDTPNRTHSSQARMYETEMGKHTNYQFNDTIDARYNSKSKLNRSMNAKKEKSSSKITGSKKQRQKIITSSNSIGVKNISSRHQKQPGFDQSDNKKQLSNDIMKDIPHERNDNLALTPSTSSSSSKDVAPKRRAASKTLKDSRYKSYQPMNLDNYFPQRTKSESSSLEVARSFYVPQNQFPENHQYKWQSILAAPTTNHLSQPSMLRFDERLSGPKESSYENFEDTYRLRSKSVGYGGKPPAEVWVDENTMSPEMPKTKKSSYNKGTLRKKTTVKAKTTKPKKIVRSVSRISKRK